MGDGGDVENGVVVDGGVEAGVISERAFGAGLAGMNESFDDEIDISGHLEGDGFAGDEVHGALPDEAREEDFVESVRQGGGCGEGVRGVASEGDGDGHGFAALVVSFSVARGDFVNLPMHSCFRGGEDLHPVHSEVFVAGVGVFGVNAGKSDEASSVLWPALEDGEIKQGWERGCLVGCLGWVESVDDVFARAGGDVSGFGVEESESLEGEVPGGAQVGWGFCFEEQGHFFDEFVDGIESESGCHAAMGAHDVDGKWEAGGGAVNRWIFEEEGFAAVGRLHFAVGPFGDF